MSPLEIREEVLEEFIIVHNKQLMRDQLIKQVLKINKKVKCLASPKTIPCEQLQCAVLLDPTLSM
jgi:hypothetical protein